MVRELLSSVLSITPVDDGSIYTNRGPVANGTWGPIGRRTTVANRTNGLSSSNATWANALFVGSLNGSNGTLAAGTNATIAPFSPRRSSLRINDDQPKILSGFPHQREVLVNVHSLPSVVNTTEVSLVDSNVTQTPFRSRYEFHLLRNTARSSTLLNVSPLWIRHHEGVLTIPIYVAFLIVCGLLMFFLWKPRSKTKRRRSMHDTPNFEYGSYPPTSAFL